MALAGQGNHERAIPKLENALRFDSANHEARCALILSMAHLGHTGARLEEQIRRLRTFRPDLAEVAECEIEGFDRESPPRR